MNALGRFDLAPKQVALIKHTVAADCDEDEFNLYMEAARAYGLDPFRRQIIPLVFGKKSRDKSRRRMSIVVTRDGLRVIAQRCKNYRPASEPAEVVIDPALIGPTNPKGIVVVRIKLWQQDNQGAWYPVMGEAYWAEFAPLSYPPECWETYDTGNTYEDSGKKIMARRLRPGSEEKRVLDDSGQWAKMPIVMIVKCAEVAALRAGWPDQFGGLYAEEELEKSRILDLTASEIVLQEERDTRLKAVAAYDAIAVYWTEGLPIEYVPLGQFHDRAAEFIRDHPAPAVKRWQDLNRESLRQFWAKAPDDGLDIAKLLEAKLAGGGTEQIHPAASTGGGRDLRFADIS